MNKYINLERIIKPTVKKFFKKSWQEQIIYFFYIFWASWVVQPLEFCKTIKRKLWSWLFFLKADLFSCQAYKRINFYNYNIGLLFCYSVTLLLAQFVSLVLQMSLVVETNLQKKRGKTKRHLLFLRHREAQRQKKKGNKKDNDIILIL